MIKYTMVHGDHYGINYFIYLTKPIDLFNDLLPICISNRYMINLINPTKISIFNLSYFHKRLKSEDISSLCSTFSELRNNSCYNYNLFKHRNLFPDLYLYYDVFKYSNMIKGKTYNIISDEEFDIMKTRYNELEIKIIENNYDNYDLYSEEFHKLRKIIEIQVIINDKEYFQKIKEIEEKITNVQLTDEEIMLIKNIESHPIINEIIETSGFEIIKEFH
jgi:hypothetical protein